MVKAGLCEEPRRATGRAPAALGDMRDQQPVLGAGGGDVEQAALLGEPLGVGRGQRPPGGQQLLFAGEQRDRLGLGALGPMDRRDGDPPVRGGVELLGVQPGGVLEESGEGRVLVLLLVGLGRAAERAEVLEHPFGVAAAVGVGGVVALVLVVAGEFARHRHRRDRHMPNRASGGEVGPGLLEEQALLERLADAVRQKAASGEIDDEVAVIAEHVSRPEQPILARVYESPASRPARSLLWGLMTQPASVLQHPLENQLSEVIAFLIDRSPRFASGFLRLCDGDRDGALRVAVERAEAVGARTRISLPAPAPEGLPKRATLFPDISIEGDNRSFQIFVEVKVDAEPHVTTIAGVELLQPDAYAAAWRQIYDVEAAKVRRVCTLTRAVTDVLDPTGGRSDTWRRVAVTWRQVGELIDHLLEDEAEPQLSIILGELRSIIDTVVYQVEIDPDQWEFVQTTGRIVLDALVEEFTRLRPDAQPSSAVTVRTDYVGRYLTVPVNGQPLRLWLYATPEGGRYNLVNEQASILIAIADQPAEGPRQPEDLAAAAQRLDLKVQRNYSSRSGTKTQTPSAKP